MHYRAKGTFNTGSEQFQRGRVYQKIPKGYEGHFEVLDQPKETKKAGLRKVETAAKKPKAEKRNK